MSKGIKFTVEGYDTKTTIEYEDDDIVMEDAFNTCLTLLRSLGFPEKLIQQEIDERSTK